MGKQVEVREGKIRKGLDRVCKIKQQQTFKIFIYGLHFEWSNKPKWVWKQPAAAAAAHDSEGTQEAVKKRPLTIQQKPVNNLTERSDVRQRRGKIILFFGMNHRPSGLVLVYSVQWCD